MSKKTKEVTKLKEVGLTTAKHSAGLVKSIQQTEDIGNAMYATAQEFLLAIEDVLIRYHGFDDKDLKNFHLKLTPILKGVAEYEKHGLSLLSPRDIGIVAEIAETRLLKERANRAGFEMPLMPGAAPFIKKLKEKNKDK